MVTIFIFLHTNRIIWIKKQIIINNIQVKLKKYHFFTTQIQIYLFFTRMSSKGFIFFSKKDNNDFSKLNSILSIIFIIIWIDILKLI